MDTYKQIRLAVAKYLGNKPIKCEIVEDPQVPDTYAIRARILTGRNKKREANVEFLLTLGRLEPTIENIESNLEECEYTTWPPISGKLKFFL
jgi:hypothetical protein